VSGEHHHHQAEVKRRDDAEETPQVERFQVDRAGLLEFLAEERRDQEAAQEEEDRDAEAAGDHVPQLSMSDEDKQERDGANAVQRRNVKLR